MKIAVYTCALNEEKFVERWLESVADADQILVLDTGSTDRTVEMLKEHRCGLRHAAIRPWRFDDAKNMALASVHEDIQVCVQVDMDEVLVPGWRNLLEAAWVPGTTRLKYRYVWNWQASGKPDQVYFADKIGGRFTHRWRGAAHEILRPTQPESVAVLDAVLIEHHADSNKSRASYLPLLCMAVEEEPLNDRHAHYYARELYFHKKYEEAFGQFQRHLLLPAAQWLPERAASLRYMAKCQEHLNNTAAAYKCYMLATLEDPQSREAYIDLAQFMLRHQEYPGVLHFCQKASNIPADSSSYINERYAREEGPFDLASVALYNMGQFGPALEFSYKALEFNPDDLRLQTNLNTMEEAYATAKDRNTY
jgi:glycosyltransferase involved in cell wall biosynthesis